MGRSVKGALGLLIASLLAGSAAPAFAGSLSAGSPDHTATRVDLSVPSASAAGHHRHSIARRLHPHRHAHSHRTAPRSHLRMISASQESPGTPASRTLLHFPDLPTISGRSLRAFGLTPYVAKPGTVRSGREPTPTPAAWRAWRRDLPTLRRRIKPMKRTSSLLAIGATIGMLS